MNPAIEIDSTWFKITGSQKVFADYNDHLTLRCASLLKPLYMWAAASIEPYKSDYLSQERLAREAVVVSSNTSTTIVWETAGPKNILKRMHELTGNYWDFDKGRNTWGGIRINARSVAEAYACLVISRDSCAKQIIEWMKEVPEEQTFGLRSTLAQHLGCKKDEIGIKCGWFINEDETKLRTHAVTLIPLPNGDLLGSVVLTASPMSHESRKSYARKYIKGAEVLGIHTEAAGKTLTDETKRIVMIHHPLIQTSTP